MKIDPEISGCSIVFVGQFNPAIFSPAWMFANDLERDDDATDVAVEVIHQDIARFSIDTRSYQIDRNRFQVNTAVAPWVLISDLAARLFGELLPHSPVRAFGINRNVHFNVKDDEVRIRLGRVLAPIEHWGEFGQMMEDGGSDEVGGLQSLTMRRISKFESYELQTNAKIEPSFRTDPRRGVYMEVNHHHKLVGLEEGHGALPAVEILQENFQPRVDEADAIVDTIMEMG